MSLRISRNRQAAAVPSGTATSPASNPPVSLEETNSAPAAATSTLDPSSSEVPDRVWALQLRDHGLSAEEAMNRCRQRNRAERHEREFQAFINGESLYDEEEQQRVDLEQRRRDEEQRRIDQDVKRRAEQNNLLLSQKKIDEQEKEDKRRDIEIASGITCKNKFTAKSNGELDTCIKEVEDRYTHGQLGYDVCYRIIAYSGLSDDLRRQWAEHQIQNPEEPSWGDMKEWMRSKLPPLDDQILASIKQLDGELQDMKTPEAFFRKLRHIREDAPFSWTENIWMGFARCRIPPGRGEWEHIFNRHPAPTTLDQLESAARGWSLSRPTIATSVETAGGYKRRHELPDDASQAAKRRQVTGEWESSYNASRDTMKIEPPRPAIHSGDVVRDRRVEEVGSTQNWQGASNRLHQPLGDQRAPPAKATSEKDKKCFKCGGTDGHWARDCTAQNCAVCSASDHTTDRHRDTNSVTVAATPSGYRHQ